MATLEIISRMGEILDRMEEIINNRLQGRQQIEPAELGDDNNRVWHTLDGVYVALLDKLAANGKTPENCAHLEELELRRQQLYSKIKDYAERK